MSKPRKPHQTPGSEPSRIREGLPSLGATWDGLGVNFALFSANATKVELCLFDDTGEDGTGAHRTARIHRRDLPRGYCPTPTQG